jgi:hypothetical protein
MPTAQTTKSGNDKNKANRRPAAKSRDIETDTGERDENYNLVSVLYHALQGAETSGQYQQDAQESGDEQLAQFFEEARTGQAEIAREAKRLLASRLDAGPEDDEDEGDEDEEDDDED